jgi:hypothetical protein
MPEPLRDHLEAATVAAFAEQRLSGEALDAAERHLAQCSTCRREVAQVVRVLRVSPLWTRPAVQLAAAAVLVIVIGLWPKAGDPGLRSDPASSALTVIGPDSTASAGDPLTFAWHAVGPNTRYEFSLADASGSRIFSTGSPDTLITLPDSVRLEQGRTYQWFVDALRPDGQSTTSGLRFIRIVP